MKAMKERNRGVWVGIGCVRCSRALRATTDPLAVAPERQRKRAPVVSAAVAAPAPTPSGLPAPPDVAAARRTP